jgi:hypothetical protein
LVVLVALLREDPVNEILDLVHVVRRISLDDPVMLGMAIQKFGHLTRGNVMDQLSLGIRFAFVLGGDVLVIGAVLFRAADAVALEAIIGARQIFGVVGIDGRNG